jgi:hypothetical protein
MISLSRAQFAMVEELVASEPATVTVRIMTSEYGGSVRIAIDRAHKKSVWYRVTREGAVVRKNVGSP